MADGIPIDYSSMYCEDIILNNSNISNQNHHVDISISSNNNDTSYSSTNSNNIQQPPIPTIRGKATGAAYKSLDGSFVTPKHRESSVDLRQVVAKLNNLPKGEHHAMNTLNKHLSSIIISRRRQQQQEQKQPPLLLPPPLLSAENHQQPSTTATSTTYRAYIQYSDEKETFVVRVKQNTLKAVREKMPKRGNYRYFFKQGENTCEEIEHDDAFVPFLEKSGCKQIHCQVFPF